MFDIGSLDSPVEASLHNLSSKQHQPKRHSVLKDAPISRAFSRSLALTHARAHGSWK
jgi:hypothetical protein